MRSVRGREVGRKVVEGMEVRKWDIVDEVKVKGRLFDALGRDCIEGEYGVRV